MPSTALSPRGRASSRGDSVRWATAGVRKLRQVQPGMRLRHQDEGFKHPGSPARESRAQGAAGRVESAPEAAGVGRSRSQRSHPRVSGGQQAAAGDYSRAEDRQQPRASIQVVGATARYVTPLGKFTTCVLVRTSYSNLQDKVLYRFLSSQAPRSSQMEENEADYRRVSLPTPASSVTESAAFPVFGQSPWHPSDTGSSGTPVPNLVDNSPVRILSWLALGFLLIWTDATRRTFVCHRCSVQHFTSSKHHHESFLCEKPIPNP